MKILVDTNVFLEYLFKREDYQTARNFFVQAVVNRHQVLVTSMSIRDIGYVAQKELHDWRKARDIQNKVYQVCSKVIGVSADAAIESLFTDWKDYEDSLQNECATENGCLAIVTYNKKDYENSALLICTPGEMIELYSKT